MVDRAFSPPRALRAAAPRPLEPLTRLLTATALALFALPAASLTRTYPLPEMPADKAVTALLTRADTTPVDAIRSVERVESWQTLGTRHVVLSVDASRTYLLTLQRHCQVLNWAQSVNVSRSGNVIWAEFDYVNADGERCGIGAIHRLAPQLESDAPPVAAPL
ncbi:MAG: DUF6491 family protein [Pseudomonadota bacterium]